MVFLRNRTQPKFGSTTEDINPKRIIPKHIHQKSAKVTK